MMKQLWDWFRQALFLTPGLGQVTKTSAELQQEMKDQSDVLREIVLQMRHERELRDRDKQILMLELERELNKLERRLPPPNQDK